MKNSGASDSNLLAVSEDEAENFLPRNSHAFFIAISMCLLTETASLTGDLLIQCTSFSYFGFLKSK